MRKVICKVEYDTENAEFVKKVTSGEFGDVDGYEESLYVKTDGKYFLYVNGGPASKHPEENIIRMSKEKTKKWLADNE